MNDLFPRPSTNLSVSGTIISQAVHQAARSFLAGTWRIAAADYSTAAAVLLLLLFALGNMSRSDSIKKSVRSGIDRLSYSFVLRN